MGILLRVFAVLIPGMGGFLRRKYLLAAAVIILWAALLEMYFLTERVSPSGLSIYTQPALLAAIVALFAANAVNEISHLARERKNRLATRIGDLYSAALAAFVAGLDQKADELLAEALHLDELDVDCLLLRAEVAIRLSKKRRARRLLRKCSDFDEKGKWKWEIAAALDRL